MYYFKEPNIEKLKARRNIKGLIVALRDVLIHPAAVRALIELDDPRAVKPLIAIIKSPKKCWSDITTAIEILDNMSWEPGHDENAAWYWAAKGDVEQCVSLGEVAVEPLIHIFDKTRRYSSPSATEINRRVVSALAEIGDSRAVEPLITEIKHRYSSEIASALVKIGDDRVVELLIDKLSQPQMYDRSVAGILGEVGDPRAVEPLIARLTNYGWRGDAALALGKIGDPRAVESLIAVLPEDRDGNVASALGMIGDARAVEPLVAALNHRENLVRFHAAHALKKIGWEPDTDELAGLYWIGLDDWEQCAEAGIGPLLVGIKSSDKYVRLKAAEALKKTGWEPDSDEIAAWYYVSKHSWQQCVPLGRAAVAPLIVALGDDELGTGAAAALVEIGNPAASGLAAVLRKNRSDSAQRAGGFYVTSAVAICAVDVLSRINNSVAVDALIDVVRYGKDASLCRCAADALGDIGDTRAVEPLIALLEKSDVGNMFAARSSAATALGKIGDRRALPVLSHAASFDPDTEVRVAARTAQSQLLLI